MLFNPSLTHLLLCLSIATAPCTQLRHLDLGRPAGCYIAKTGHRNGWRSLLGLLLHLYLKEDKSLSKMLQDNEIKDPTQFSHGCSSHITFLSNQQAFNWVSPMLQRSLSDTEISTANSPSFWRLPWLCYIMQAAILAKRSRYQPPVVFALINCTKCQ